MGEKKRLSLWISLATRDKLMALADRYGTQTEVLAVAIDRMHREEFGEEGEPQVERES